MLAEFMARVDTGVIGKGLELNDLSVDNRQLVAVNAAIRNHPVERIGGTLRASMSAMKWRAGSRPEKCRC